ncbi:MAG: hypothetical protein M3516_03405 [Actinomycetota bacterium]|nr:hypothetical protein [Actinomycetota bacterium]
MSRTRRSWAQVYEECAPSLTAFVELLCGDRQLARRMAQRTVLRSLVTWRDVRDGETLELRLRGRAAIALARRHRLGRVLHPRSNQAEVVSTPDESQRRWLLLPVMRRAILALLIVEDRSLAEVAVALDRSESAVRAAAAHASRRLGYPDLEQGEGLREMFAQLGRGATRGPDPAPRWTGWQRGISAVLSLALLAAASVASVEVAAAIAREDVEDRSLAAERAAVDLSTPERALNVARHSTFQWCPDVAAALPFDASARRPQRPSRAGSMTL